MTATKTKHPLDYPVVVGDKDGKWDLSTEFHTLENLPAVDFYRVEAIEVLP